MQTFSKIQKDYTISTNQIVEKIDYLLDKITSSTFNSCKYKLKDLYVYLLVMKYEVKNLSNDKYNINEFLVEINKVLPIEFTFTDFIVIYKNNMDSNIN